MEELIAYLKENGIAYTEVSNAVLEIDGRTYELYVPADDGSLFDDGFCFIGKPYDTELHEDNETLADRYVYRFGGVWYWLDKGQENDVKLNRLKYLGESAFPLPTDTFLGVHGQYEILSGSGTYTDWCRKAKFLGVRNLGICEVNSLAGALKFQMECQKFGIKPIIGMGCTVYDIDSDVRFVVKVYARNFEGWQALLTINTEINCVNSRWVALDRFREIIRGNDDITVILDPKTLDYEEFRKANIDTVFYQLDTCAYSDERHDEWYLKNLKKFFYDTNLVPLVFSDAWYIDAEYADIPDRLHRIAGRMGYASDNQYFKSNEAVYGEFLQLFSEEEVGAELFLESMQLLNDIADGCDFTIDTANRHLPKYEMKPDEAARYTTNEEMFLGLIEEGLAVHPELVDRWGEDVVLERLEREIDVIKFGNVIDYFLITRDIVNWCHENGILTGISRGSAGGCLISYLIGITKLDPLEYGLLFERFLNKGRVLKSLPDIDVDFTSAERPRVKKYMEERYGWDRVCSVGTYSALQLRAAIKDVCRIYGLEFQTVNEMMKAFDVDDRKPEDLFKIACADENVKKFVTEHPDIVNEVMLLMPAPKAQSIHACATMIFPKEHDMFHWVPIRKQGEEYVSEWEGNEMDGAGFLKQDILGVKQLDKFQEMITLIKENEGVDVDIYSTPLDDREVYRYFCNGWNEDNFHFGSRGLTGYCKQMQPRNIEDLIAAISLYRPGAMENGFHEDYIIRKADPSKVTYYTGTQNILENTYGIFCYQEQIMELCKQLGGLSLVEADDVRKAMVKKKYEALHQYHERFTPYYMEHFGVNHDYAESVWEAIDKASTYLFNRCISGKERIKRHSRTNGGWHPTIEEMYRCKHDRQWAIRNGHGALHNKYVGRRGYGKAWSMNDNGDLVLNNIVDIRYQGKKQTFTLYLSDGSKITVTGNHKFPTPNGFQYAENIQIGQELYVYDKNVNDWVGGNFTDKCGFKPYTPASKVEKFELNSRKGHEGFTRKGETNWKKFDRYRSELKKDICEICGSKHNRLEIHHIDGDHANNELFNLVTVCPSCHKILHYEMGRTKMGRKGIKTRIEKVVRITVNPPEDVYDVEMADPYHTFVTEEGIVTCNSHATAYAITGYISQWLKVHYPIEYWSVAFKYATDDDYPRYIAEINKTGVCEVKPVDINISTKNVVIDFKTQSLYWSIMGVKQVADKAADQILKERDENGQYWSIEDFVSRHNWKGTAVNSRVIKNLILSGAFDSIESITDVRERVSLLRRYFEKNRIKIDDSDPLLNGAYVHREDGWWWRLMQKQLSGFAFFRYDRLYENNRGSFPDEYSYVTVEQCNDTSRKVKAGEGMVVVGGYVADVEVKTTKGGRRTAPKTFCKMTLESNYEFIEVLIFGGDYDRLQEFVKKAKNNIILINGSLSNDSKKGMNIIRADMTTRMLIFALM